MKAAEDQGLVTANSKYNQQHTLANTSQMWTRDWLTKVLRPTRHKTGHFGDVRPSQSLGLVLKN